MHYTLRPYQRQVVDDAVPFLRNASPGKRRLYSLPTGTGKSVIELHIQSQFDNAWIVTPRLEIVSGMLDKLGYAPPESEGRLAALAWSLRITTPMRLRNAMLAGEAQPPPYLIVDECHHDAAQSYQDIHALAGYCPAVGLTATPYRGTPRGTALLRELWGTPVCFLTFIGAKVAGYLSMPTCKMLPLVDDDLIEIENGELVASQVNDATRSRLADLCHHARTHWVGDGPQMWDRPTMFAAPSTEIARELAERLNGYGARAVCVLGDTVRVNREASFRGCIERLCAIVQVYVVSEGVDLPIRRLVDLAPTMSPVKWVQQFGRITRPGGESEYVCTNRNLFRHAYTLNGAVPTPALLDAQTAFPTLSKRAAARVVGLEALGRLKPNDVPLACGLSATTYMVSAVEGDMVVDYCALAHPNQERMFWARRDSKRNEGEARTWGRWQACGEPASLEGYTSVKPSPLTDKQRDWWQRAAKRHGLDDKAEVNARVFQVLPVLRDCGVRV